MSPAISSFPLLLAQNIKVTNWLTPVWIVSLGVAVGFVLVILMLIKILVMQRIPGINSVTEKPALRWIFGIITSLLYLAMFIGFWFWRFGPDHVYRPGASLADGVAGEPNYILPLVFVIPLSILMGFGVWSVVSRRMIGETFGLFREGFLGWVNKVCIGISIFAVLGFVLGSFGGFGVIKFVDEPMEFVNSITRLPIAKQYSIEVEIPPTVSGDEGTPVPVDFESSELKWLSIKSDQKLEMMHIPISSSVDPAYIFDVSVQDEPNYYFQRKDGRGKIPYDPLLRISNIYIKNLNKSSPATVNLGWELTPIYEEVSLIPAIAIGVFGIYLLYFILATLCPKVFAIAHSTFKTEVNQPLYILVMLIGLVFVVGSIYVPYNTFGEDIKMYKDSGLTLIRVLAIFLAIWAASKSVAAEIEGRTALTVLSKPVGRRQFIFGKFTGISLAIALMFIVLGFWFFAWVSYKPIYDFQEASKGLCEWPQCFLEATHVVPGLFLCFLEVLIFVAISVAISTRFGVLVNFLLCFSVYVLGHLTPLLVQSSYAAFEPVVVFGQLVAIVFPVLNHFDVQAAINTNSPVPMEYLGWSVIYTAIYGGMAMLLALVLFEDRDLA